MKAFTNLYQVAKTLRFELIPDERTKEFLEHSKLIDKDEHRAEMMQEGLAREIVNRVQNLRKTGGFEVTDRIELLIEKNEKIDAAVEKFGDYICTETLATINKVDTLEGVEAEELVEGVNVKLKIQKKL